MTTAWVIILALVALAAALPFLAERVRRPIDAGLRADAPGQFADLPGGVTHYRWTGPSRGPVAVCIHGLTTPSFVWDCLAERLGEMGFRTLVYDLWGRGLSDRPPGRQDVDFFLRQLDELLAHEELGEDLTLVGYSMGGVIASAFAARNPGRVLRLILVAPAGIEMQESRLQRFVRQVPFVGDWLFRLLYPARYRRDVAAAARAWNTPDAGRLARLQKREVEFRGFVPAVLSSLRWTLARPIEGIHRRLAEIGMPILAIWGDRDEVIPISAMGVLAEWNPKARHEVVEGAGHGLPFTHCDEVAGAISRFVTAPA